VVTDGEELCLGKNTLRFVIAPLLHWPDTMFTYCEAKKTVFTCDFLGSHYCEPNMMDTRVVYPDKYREAFYGYYRDIFSPFLPNVRYGLEKLKELKFDTVCVSHGPVLTKGGMLAAAIKSYTEWSAEATASKTVPVFFCSAYGYTKKLALAAAEAIAEAGFDAKTYDLNDVCMQDAAAAMNAASAFMVGSPTLNRDAVGPVWQLLAGLEAISAQKKLVAVFGSYGWSGEAVSAISGRLNGAKVKTFGEGFKVNFNPSADDISAMKAFAKDFVAAALK
jgi:flavorubredoxin